MKFFQFLQRALSEDNGNPSSIRVNTFIAIISLVPAITYTLIYTVRNYEGLVTATLISVLSFLAALFGIKVIQKGGEEKPPTP